MASENVTNIAISPLAALMQRQCAERPDAPFVLSAADGRRVSFAELYEGSRRFTESLSCWGAKPGERLGLIVADPLTLSQVLLAGMAAGLWIAPLDPTLRYTSAADISERIKNLDLCAVLSDQRLPFEAEIDWLVVDQPDSWPPRVTTPRHQVDSAGGVILASSGTTGTPKVMALATDQLLEAARLIASHNHLEPVDRGFNPLPLWHINAIVVGLVASLLAGSSLVIDDRFHRTNFWSTVAQYGVTWINAVPAIIARLGELVDGEKVPAGIRFIRSASAPLAPSLLERFETVTGIPVIESYGMTEAASQICANPLDGPRKTGSVGRPVGVEVRITPLERREAGDETLGEASGEVEIRGASVITQYAVPGYESRFDADQWLRTGDLGYLDDDGYLFLIGRTDDVINRGGEKILPRGLEEAALRVAGVTWTAVVARDDDVYGQVPEMYVELDGVTSETPREQIMIAVKELHDELMHTFSRTHRPVAINVVESMPAHSTGKIRKRELAAGRVNILYQHRVS